MTPIQTPDRNPDAVVPQADTASHGLPPQVRAALRLHQDASEVTIGWVQLVVVLAFASLYAISPKTFPAEAEFIPIPWVLAAYLAFTVGRLAFAYARPLPRWFLALSVVADMALLLGTIWSFHLQYMQPAAFYLKAPTLLYVFIFIALRTLRFEPAFVLLSGGAAAVGWVAMAGYALVGDPYGAPVTRDYVFYLTSNAILIGAEFDKVVSILMVTAILAIAIVRARRLLVTAVEESLTARQLSRFISHDAAARITDLSHEVQVGRGEFREVAVMYVDIRGFTSLSKELAPDDVIALLAEYQHTVVPIIQDAGGDIDKFLGDGILVTFGTGVATGRETADALRAVDAALTALNAWRLRRAAAGLAAPDVGVAVSSGTVVFGAVGDPSRLEYTVIGPAVNLAAKLEKMTRVESVRALTDRQTWEKGLAQGYVPSGPREMRSGRSVNGVRDPVDLVIVAP